MDCLAPHKTAGDIVAVASGERAMVVDIGAQKIIMGKILYNTCNISKEQVRLLDIKKFRANQEGIGQENFDLLLCTCMSKFKF